MATGDSGCEAYTAIAWGVGLSHERSYIAGAESFYSLERQHVRHRYARCCRPTGVEGHITCKRIVSEPGRSRVWPSLLGEYQVRRSASGRRGAVADDARAWEVGRGHSSCEAGEQGRAICCGVRKSRGQGECAPSKHAPDTVPGSACHRRWLHAYHRVFDGAFGPEVGAV